MSMAFAKSDFAIGYYCAGRGAGAATASALQNLELLLANYRSTVLLSEEIN